MIRVPCKPCAATGKVLKATCLTCAGRKYVEFMPPPPPPPPPPVREIQCSPCSGFGCSLCHWTGGVSVPETCAPCSACGGQREVRSTVRWEGCNSDGSVAYMETPEVNPCTTCLATGCEGARPALTDSFRRQALLEQSRLEAEQERERLEQKRQSDRKMAEDQMEKAMAAYLAAGGSKDGMQQVFQSLFQACGTDRQRVGV